MKERSNGARRAQLDIARWHFQHGPIDLIIDVDAEPALREHAIDACWKRFQDVLATLVSELPHLRRGAHERPDVRGPVARRMLSACLPFAPHRFITPMAAVAGSVADEMLDAIRRPGVRRASINNGGDIAVLLAAGMSYRVGIASQIERPRSVGTHVDRPLVDGAFTVHDRLPVRGIATSGWRGRSFSLGIADSVTVLAGDAAAADAAATLIANAVDADDPRIRRRPANQMKDDTDLHDRLVTVEVPGLAPATVAAALARGRAEAELWRERGVVYAVALSLQGQVEVVLPRETLNVVAA